MAEDLRQPSAGRVENVAAPLAPVGRGGARMAARVADGLRFVSLQIGELQGVEMGDVVNGLLRLVLPVHDLTP